jgi:ribosomal protein L24
MKSFHVKKNDEVVVLSGADKGKRGRVISILGKKAG